MIINYDGKKIDFNQTHSLSVEESDLVFHQETNDQILRLQPHLAPRMDEIADFIVYCFKRGDHEIHLNDHLAKSSTAIPKHNN
ncbi:hypothetical protein [Piscirickettsia litoralis]|uniref:Uncharacterized protein n=1 Tax=Piscirickettsia litoralis TaxID=1891921 RepID=A0ABX3A4P7_9GAMM|nr:hypothetical protein [Piscirickettsia litoralis]ODN43470.1 hypothetical protein BGC07_11735 [Piscirickettsia litoralis]